MKRIVFLVSILLVYAVTALSFTACGKTNPENVVLRSFDALKDGDFEALESCYSESAWEVVSDALPSSGDKEVIESLKDRMRQISKIQIQDSKISGEKAEVSVLIIHDDGSAEIEECNLVKDVRKGWLID